MSDLENQQVFQITFEAKKGNKWEDIYGAEHYFNYLPRTNDIIIIDSCYLQVLCVEYSNKLQFNPTVRVKLLGDFEEYSRNLL